MDDDGEAVTLDEKGRVSLPRHIRDTLGLAAHEELKVSIERGEIRLRPVTRPVPKLKAKRKWGRDAFVSAGETLVGPEK